MRPAAYRLQRTPHMNNVSAAAPIPAPPCLTLTLAADMVAEHVLPWAVAVMSCAAH